MARLLPIFIISSLFVVSLQIIKYTYFPFYVEDGKTSIDALNYDETRKELLVGETWRATLNNKYVRDNYVEVFTPYRPRYHDPVIRHKFPEMAVSRYQGVKFEGAFSIGKMYNRSANQDSLLMAMASMHRLYVDDSLRSDITPRFHFNEIRQQPGLLYMLPVHSLTLGEHYVRVQRQRLRADTLQWAGEVNIYFYK